MKIYIPFFSDNDHYGDTYEYLCESIAPFVSDINNRCKELQQVSTEWEQAVAEILNYFVSDIAINSSWTNILFLDRVYYSLKEIIVPLLKTNVEEKKSHKEGVLNTFYNILICYYFKCNENDRIINAYSVPYVFSDANYIEKYKMYDNIPVSMEYIEDIKKYLSGKTINNSDVDKFTELIFYKKNIADNYVKNVLYALDHVESYWKIVKKAKHIDENENLCLGILVSIIQEIILIKETKPQIINTYLGHENAQKSLLRIISSPDEDNGIAFQVLTNRLENRVSINTGGRELIARARIIQKEIYRIKKLIFSYQNLEDIVGIHKIIYANVVNIFKQNRMDFNILKSEVENQLSIFSKK